MTIKIMSSTFKDGQMLPKRCGYDNENSSPALSWSGLPAGAKSLAVICDDPDAPGGDWVHWVIFNIPSGTGGLPEKMSKDKVLKDGSRQGMNDFRKTGYDGPCPPSGTHRYVFKVYALDTLLELKDGATKQELLDSMKGHILAEGRIVGLYSRQ